MQHARWRRGRRVCGGRQVFHTVENFFPRCGKIGRIFSTVWKSFGIFFHGVEKFFPHCGKLAEHGDGILVRVAAVDDDGLARGGGAGQHGAEQLALGGRGLGGIIVIEADLADGHHAGRLGQRGEARGVARLVGLVAIVAHGGHKLRGMLLGQLHDQLVGGFRAAHGANALHPRRARTGQHLRHTPLRRKGVKMRVRIEEHHRRGLRC